MPDSTAELAAAAEAWDAEGGAPAPAPSPVPTGPRILPGLWTWFVIISGLGIAGIAFGQAELALSVALAGAFVAAHAADRDSSFAALHQLLSAVLIAGGAMVLAGLAYWDATQLPAIPATRLAVGVSGVGAMLCLLTAFRPVSNALGRMVFRVAEPSRALRLAARLVMMVLLFGYPGWTAFPGILESLTERGRPLVDTGQLVGSVVGLAVLALGAVGFMVRRDTRATLERLGLRALRPAHLGVVALGLITLSVLNLGGESVQHRWLPELWRHDQRVSQLIAGGLGVWGSLLLGVSAGVGEELTMRGALQPRLGVVLTSLVFASLHVQYSWFGIATIFLLGVLLGVLRDRTSTTVAIVVHALYDISAVFIAGGAD